MSEPPSSTSANQPILALVTGGSRRLGKAIALALAREGYAIGLHYFRSAGEVEATAAEIRALGVAAYPLYADLSDPGQIDELFAAVACLPERLGVLVNSAAVMARGDLLSLSPAEWDSVMALNLRAPLLCAQRAARLMEEGGLIVNISDTGARKNWTGFPAYTVSKAALETLTRLLARVLAPRIRVNGVAPGLILPSRGMEPEAWERLTERVPLKRGGKPEEIAQTVAFLVHNEYITGQTIVVDGGYQVV